MPEGYKPQDLEYSPSSPFYPSLLPPLPMGCSRSKLAGAYANDVLASISLPSREVQGSNPEIHVSKHELHKQQRAAVPPPPTRWSQTINGNRDITSNWMHTKRAKTEEEVEAQRRYETRHLPEEQRRRAVYPERS